MYDWGSNKGYSCKSHFHALHEHGPISFHRKSFRPVQQDRQLTLESQFAWIEEPADSEIVNPSLD